MKRLMVICTLLFSALAWSEDAINLLTHEEPPFVYLDQQEQLTGYAVELVRGIQARLDNRDPILLNPWARAYMRATEQGRVLLFPLVRNAEREALFHWIMPLTRNVHGVFSAHKPHTPVTSLTDLEQFSAIGVQRGDFRESLLIDAGLKNLVSYTTWKQAVAALLKGRVEALFFSAGGLEFYCGELHEDCSELYPLYTHNVETTYVALSRKGITEKEALLWRQAAQEYRASRAFVTLKDNWLARFRKEHGLTLHYADGVIKLWAQRPFP
ncbi:transporter substrate-binding domain-containing protein [Lacimicrobium sp. SS2-24]|uniref:substrate-binding periplasmic protein n=1 Tax=Lacimicrobium sp. SS2-24 TaxID=2005569 RepID=UPI001439952E|nr:transporter substrate-binding domain-containing protein [Lacimicrobium sp. SS2-24]